MHLPLNGLVLGEAAGEGDFGAVLVGNDVPHDLKDEDEDEEAEVNDRDAEMRRLRFTRTKRESMSVTEKRAWVVSPGMGHIGSVLCHICACYD
jgi:uridine kinase